MLQRLQSLLGTLLVLVCLVTAGGPAVRAQTVDLPAVALERQDGALVLDFSARLNLSRTVEEALSRGVPVYFTAQASVYRNRWYWRDERIARVSRSWRLAYQPLTSNWRVSIGAIGQTYASLSDALAAIARLSGWKLAELSQIDSDARHYVEFSFRLDTSQLPGPMLIGLTSQAEWQLAFERTLRLE